MSATKNIVAIFYPFSQFCEINVSLLSLQKQPNAAPNLFQRGGRIWQVWQGDCLVLGGAASVEKAGLGGVPGFVCEEASAGEESLLALYIIDYHSLLISNISISH